MPNQPAIILASGSPRRQHLIKTLGLPFTVMVSDVSEDVDSALSPAEAVRWLARLKAEVVAEEQSAGLVIGADTMVVLDGMILGKPANAAEARHMLGLLRGRAHQVLSGVAVFDAAQNRSGATSHVATTVWMNDTTDAQIDAYVASGEPMDKAGSYAIQGQGGALVARIEGCHNNVVGFPLCEVRALLDGFGVRLNGSDQEPVCALPDGRPCPNLGR
ncbi:Maf family protein [Chloroflexota bacterium]